MSHVIRGSDSSCPKRIGERRVPAGKKRAGAAEDPSGGARRRDGWQWGKQPGPMVRSVWQGNHRSPRRVAGKVRGIGSEGAGL
jgi:hypothetical protein